MPPRIVLLIWFAFLAERSNSVVRLLSNLRATGSTSTRSRTDSSRNLWSEVAIRIAPIGDTNSHRMAAEGHGKRRLQNFGIQLGDQHLPHGNWDPTRKAKPIFQ